MITNRVRREVTRFYDARRYGQLSNYVRYLTVQGDVIGAQYAQAALDVIRGGIWMSGEEARAAKSQRAYEAAIARGESEDWARFEALIANDDNLPAWI